MHWDEEWAGQAGVYVTVTACGQRVDKAKCCIHKSYIIYSQNFMGFPQKSFLRTMPFIVYVHIKG